MSDLDPAAVMDEHERIGFATCAVCDDDDWPCQPYRLASALFSEQAKVARVVEMAHRFELIPRARLLGALTAKAKS